MGRRNSISSALALLPESPGILPWLPVIALVGVAVLAPATGQKAPSTPGLRRQL